MFRRKSQGSRPRRRAPLLAEALESRALLSGGSTGSSAPWLRQTEDVGVPLLGPNVSQKTGALNFTLTRAGTYTTAAINEPLVVDVSASLAPSASKTGAAFQPFNESVTFPAGVKTESVSIPIQLGANAPDSVPINISVTTSKASAGVSISRQTVYLVSGPQALPPSITSAQLIVEGNHVTGVSLSFSKPMAAATVGNVHNYAFGTFRAVTYYDWFGLAHSKEPTFMPIALKSAEYDPTTDTVTLKTKKPLSSSMPFGIQCAYPPAKHRITDQQGLALYRDGSSSIPLQGGKRGLLAVPTLLLQATPSSVMLARSPVA
jgi:hypothetical protein